VTSQETVEKSNYLQFSSKKTLLFYQEKPNESVILFSYAELQDLWKSTESNKIQKIYTYFLGKITKL